MKKVFALLLCMVLTGVAANARVTHLLPTPQKIQTTSASFALGRAVAVTDPTNSKLLQSVLTEAGCTIEAGAAAKVNVSLVQSISGASEPTLAGFENEAYTLSVEANQITITAISRLGVIRAAQTLQQLAEDENGHVAALEGVNITDWAAFKVRGFMHDVGRSFITFEELKRQIKLYSRYKINFFQWHMTENQAWRFEVKAYPQLTESKNMTRFAGNFYTQEQCKELDELGYEYGVYVVPEIDMPGHSEAFKRAMGHDMQTTEGVKELKRVIDEVVECFPHAPYIHIGGDEVTINNVDGENFLIHMSKYVHDKGQRVMWWNPTRNVGVNKANGCDMAQCWSTSGRQISGLPCIDCRYNYTNHFDVFADLAGMYRSTILYKKKGDAETAGFISCPWNDRKTATQEDIIAQNNVFAVTIASGERAWKGGGEGYIETQGAVLPNSGAEYEEFKDWERRFLFHKANSLSVEPIPYVKQTNVRWRISDPIGNNGNASAVFAWDNLKGADVEIPEAVKQGSRNYGWTLATGAGIYLNHTWPTEIPGIWGKNQGINQTAYAYTYVYSDKEQTVGAQIEFQNYGRSERDAAPSNGNWDRKGSDIWLNGQRIAPPTWENNGGGGGNYETLLKNENFPARKPIAVKLNKGWNKVFIKLPYVGSGCRLNKWLFTFVLTDLEGINAIDGLVYSPTQTLEGEEPVPAPVENDDAPKVSNADYTYYYSLVTPGRGPRYATSKGANQDMVGETSASNASYWKLVQRQDGDLDIVNYADQTYVSPNSTYNTALKTQSTSPSKGWKIKDSDTKGLFIIVSGDVEWNQTNSGQNFKVYNWGSGTNVSDPGCRYQFNLIEEISTLPEEEYQYAGVEAGKTYRITNVQQNGNKRALYVEGDALTLGAVGTDATAYGTKAEFKVEGHKEQVAFKNVATNLYMIFRGKGNGYNSDKGTLATYTEPYCLWTINPSANVTDGYYFYSMRNNGTTTGTLIVMSSNGAWDAWGNTEGYGPNYSNVYLFEEVPTTGISTFNSTATKSATAYDLQGRIVNNNTKGITLRGGQKVIR